MQKYPATPHVIAEFVRQVRYRKDGCWEWTGKLDVNGYGPYQKAWKIFQGAGALPFGLDLDHACHSNDERCRGGILCRHRRCVNPWHLEPVTHRENVLRGRGPTANNARKTHCPQGHPYEGQNVHHRLDGGRRCQACNAEHQRNWRKRQEAA